MHHADGHNETFGFGSVVGRDAAGPPYHSDLLLNELRLGRVVQVTTLLTHRCPLAAHAHS